MREEKPRRKFQPLDAFAPTAASSKNTLWTKCTIAVWENQLISSLRLNDYFSFDVFFSYAIATARSVSIAVIMICIVGNSGAIGVASGLGVVEGEVVGDEASV